ncbi:hypothetical protein ITP53_47720 [Nonomuraea sp. K274]|uniref:Uncharacterized protein n=1 Tax=Nonomuraea cypriaca TaxID=1187855 RepID=A0A931F423_9ACTN|nr:hypothetical protein [Nonomuraea cypriaca]
MIDEIKRLERSWAEVDVQISGALNSIGAGMTGPGLLKDVGYQIGQQVPGLQRRLDLIVATQKIGLDKGVVWADETCVQAVGGEFAGCDVAAEGAGPRVSERISSRPPA